VTTVLGEERTVEVAAGTQPGSVFKVKDAGMPEVGGHRRGSLFVHFKVLVPRKLSSEQRQLLEKAAQLGGESDVETQVSLLERLKRVLGTDE
jgi:molecular chaperone DnaJ